MSNFPGNISVIGGGSWGTALALVLSTKGYPVKIWDFDPRHVDNLAKDKENKKYLPGILFPESLTTETDLKKVIVAADMIVMVIPSHGFRTVFATIAENIKEDVIIVSATKGIENDTTLTMSQIIEEMLTENKALEKAQIGVLSGPSFAKEVAEKVPTAISVACKNENIAKIIQKTFNTNYFRVYTSPDVIGLEISASLKNIVAIAAGICDGLDFGTNTRAALITRGLAEISRFGIALGAEPETFYGLSGMGDLVLTCTGDLSRNRTVGLKLGQGKSLDDILAEMSMVAEGIKTTKSVHDLATKIGIEMPILDQVYKIIYENKDAKEAVNDLLKRDLKSE